MNISSWMSYYASKFDTIFSPFSASIQIIFSCVSESQGSSEFPNQLTSSEVLYSPSFYSQYKSVPKISNPQ